MSRDTSLASGKSTHYQYTVQYIRGTIDWDRLFYTGTMQTYGLNMALVKQGQGFD
uniref:Uncharacterized protein n=1 Tax=Anguilla anguilla TaxID=7936 RepID=A0A0E9W4Y4_ANGAN